jgi:hypothetical protein
MMVAKRYDVQLYLLVIYRGGLAPQILVEFFFKGPQKRKGQKGQSKVQNSSPDVFADEKKKSIKKN